MSVDADAALAELRASEARLAAAQALAHMGSYDWDIASDTNRWSDELYRIYGTEPQSFNASYERFLEFVHPDDREQIQAVHQRAFETGEPYETEERIVRPDGSVRTLYTTGEVLFDEAGAPLRVRGICWDVTDLRQAEAVALRLHDSENRRRQAFEINDNVLQGLTTALYALEGGQPDVAMEAVRQTLAASRQMIDELLGDGPTEGLRPGDLVRDAAAPRMPVVPSQMRRPPPGARWLRVLLVDDAEDLRTILRLNLEREGVHIVGEAGDGYQAVRLSAELRPDVVLLDLAMPGMDGLEALPLIKAAAPETEVVVLSGFDSSRAQAAAVAQGASACLQKGTSIGAILAVLRQVRRQPADSRLRSR